MVDRVATWRLLAAGLAAVAVLGVVVLVSVPVARKACVQSSDYGTQCLTISGKGLTVTGVEAQFTTFPDFFTQRDWAFETTAYRCDPRGRAKTECVPDERTFGTLHRKNPRDTASTVCTAEGISNGDNCSGHLMLSLPRTFSSARWLCVEVAVRVNGKLLDNGAGLSSGDRACGHVH